MGATNFSGPLYSGGRQVVTQDTSGYLLGEDDAVIALSEVVPEVLANPSATTTVLSRAGNYAGYVSNTAIGNITVYDSLSASGKILVPTTALAVGQFPAWGAGNDNRRKVTIGVTVVLSGADTVYIGVEAD